MTDLTIRNIPDELYNELVSVAGLHNKSLEEEVVDRLKQQLQAKTATVQSRMEGVRKLRADIASCELDEQEIKLAIGTGRE